MKWFLTFLLFFFSFTGYAQNNDLPKLSVSLAGFKGGETTSGILSRIIDSSLVARDEKGNTYTILRFRCIYKFKSRFEDPETGEKKTTDDMRVNEFIQTPVMPETWRQSIKENISKGDQMILDDIIVQLKNGTKIMAPSIRFTIVQ